MSIYKKIICTLIVIVIGGSCKKDPPVPIEIDCANFSYSSTVFTNWHNIDTVYNTPCFNPNNTNEIIYVRGIKSSGEVYLVKRNLITNKETNIISGVWRFPDWSIKDWILFNHADNQVWKIKSNGDSLTLLTKDMEGGHNPIWCDNGTKIVFAKELGNKKYNIVTDANGNHLDTIPYFSFYLNKGALNGKFVAGLSLDQINVLYADITNKQTFQPTQNVEDAHSTNMIFGDAICWTSDSQNLIWSNPHGIYKTNITTKQTIKLKNACDSKYYTSLSVSPDGKKFIAQRIDQKFTGDTLFIKTGLSLINIDGSNEIKITNP